MNYLRKEMKAFFIFIALGIILIAGCNSGQEKPQAEKAPEVAAPESPMPSANTIPPEMADAVVVVDGVKLTKSALEKDLTVKMEMLKDQVPADKIDEVKNEVRSKIINNFIMRTLFSNEVTRLKIAATNQEVTDAINKLKESLPPKMTYDEFLKKNKLTREQAKEEIILGVKIEKYVKSSVPQDPKVTDKEISDFYKNNKDKFIMPESVHARHILVKTNPEDNAKTLAEKKGKAESIRKELLGGADFGEVATKNSDCPSAQAGGDLGVFVKGQMVKPFDDAAFTQKENEIGPVVKTEYGYHIIQVIKHEGPKTMPLNEEIKGKISAYLKMKKQEQAYEGLLKKLKEKANIVVYSS
ncbi:MAG: peptidylprolyl isomerase [Syntrophaceae bacterium]|nr:peptidylprolyl isomerase [Syntrophaceae bacterium]